ncbi:MAG: DUF2148 domain-containing protein [Actinomycetia bacterium]|nr:DUF2148 domain-containing protein [Actinomycetes bacterium]
MMIDSQQAEEQAVLNAASALCAAARTAPKACGVDHLDTAVLTGADKDRLAAEMRRMSAQPDGPAFFARDADNIDAATAVVLVGALYKTRGLGDPCRLCGFDGCSACADAGATCVFTPMDLGIALGSAVALASELHVDNRIMFSIGQAAVSLRLLGDHKLIMGIPLSVSGKSPFFDRR